MREPILHELYSKFSLPNSSHPHHNAFEVMASSHTTLIYIFEATFYKITASVWIIKDIEC